MRFYVNQLLDILFYFKIFWVAVYYYSIRDNVIESLIDETYCGKWSKVNMRSISEIVMWTNFKLYFYDKILDSELLNWDWDKHRIDKLGLSVT